MLPGGKHKNNYSYNQKTRQQFLAVNVVVTNPAPVLYLLFQVVQAVLGFL